MPSIQRHPKHDPISCEAFLELPRDEPAVSDCLRFQPEDLLSVIKIVDRSFKIIRNERRSFVIFAENYALP